jgi:hypothetical protein
MTGRQTIRHRKALERWARQQCWRDERAAGLELMLAGACLGVLALASRILWWGQ